MERGTTGMTYINPLRKYDYTLKYILKPSGITWYNSLIMKDEDLQQSTIWDQVRELFIVAEEVLDEPSTIHQE